MRAFYGEQAALVALPYAVFREPLRLRLCLCEFCLASYGFRFTCVLSSEHLGLFPLCNSESLPKILRRDSFLFFEYLGKIISVVETDANGNVIDFMVFVGKHGE